MKENHKILFEPYQLAGCTLKNRYVMAAMGTGGMVTAENTFNERGIEYYVAQAPFMRKMISKKLWTEPCRAPRTTLPHLS